MKIFNHEDWEKWNDTERDFMLSLMSIQRKIDCIDKAMRDNVAYQEQTVGNSEDVTEYEEYMEAVRKYILTLNEQTKVLDEILDNI